MRNTLRLLGIIALAAIIGFGFIACNDGSTSSDDTVNNKTPVEGDYIIYNGGTVIYNGDPQPVSIVAKSGKSSGAVLIYYNNITDGVPPKDPGTYNVTFDVLPAPGWNKAEGLNGGTLQIVRQSDFAKWPVAGDFNIDGVGDFKQDDSVRHVEITPKDAPENSSPGRITIWYQNLTEGTAKTQTAPNSSKAGNYAVTFDVAPAVGWYGVEGLWAGNLRIKASQFPEAGNFDISGRSQIYDDINYTRRYLKITPKAGMSKGGIQQEFEGIGETAYPTNQNAPFAVGTYSVRFKVREDEDFKESDWLDAGIMEISLQTAAVTPELSHFTVEGSVPDGDWKGTWTFPYDGKEKRASVTAKANGPQGKITVWYSNYPNPIVYTETPPIDAGEYQVSIGVEASKGFRAIGVVDPENSILAERLVITRKVPVPGDFMVQLVDATGASSTAGVGQGPWVTALKGQEIGPYAYKNKGFSVFVRSTWDQTMVEPSWADITYNGVTYVDKPGTPEAKDVGPKDVDTYEVKLTLKPSKNFEAYAGFDVGTLKIIKAKPTLNDYVVTATAGTYNGKPGGNKGTLTVSRRATTGLPDDDVFVSPAPFTVKVGGLDYEKDSTTKVLPINAGSYNVTVDVAEDKNWFAAEGLLLNGKYTINKFRMPNEDMWQTTYLDINRNRHVQDAYFVEEFMISPVTELEEDDPDNPDKKITIPISGIGAFSLGYLKEGDEEDRAEKERKRIPQTEGNYTVYLYVADGANYYGTAGIGTDGKPTDGVKILNEYLGSEAGGDLYNFGLIVNPLVIYTVKDFATWLEAVKGKLNELDDIEEFDVKFAIEEFGLTHEQGIKALIGPGTEYSDIKLHLNFSSIPSLSTSPIYSAFSSQAFKDCETITKVTFPPDLQGVGEEAFDGCSSLTAIDTSYAAPEFAIGKRAFVGTSLKQLVLTSSSLETIGEEAFADVVSLVSVVLDVQRDENGEAVLGDDGKPAAIDDANLVKVGEKAFSGCTSLVAVHLPASVTTIDNSAFEGCVKLLSVRFDSDQGGLPLREATSTSTEGMHEDAFVGLGDLVSKFYANELTAGGGSGLYTRSSSGSKVWSNQDNPVVPGTE
jgi:hypothetical protein